MEGADPILNPEHLVEYHRRGVRALGLSWNNRNIYASGPESKEGLSDQGKELLGQMNTLGTTLDLSHLNERCFWESVELTELIPIATHSNSRALVDHPRNLRDEQLRAISERGGVIGVVFYGKFLRKGEGLRYPRRHIRSHRPHYKRLRRGSRGSGNRHGRSADKRFSGRNETHIQTSRTPRVSSRQGISDRCGRENNGEELPSGNKNESRERCRSTQSNASPMPYLSRAYTTNSAAGCCFQPLQTPRCPRFTRAPVSFC